MKKLPFLLLMVLSVNAFADCDFSTGITAGPNKTYIYTEECHLKVGQLVQTNKTQTQQLSDLTTALDLKNAALTAADSRTQLWTKTADDELDRLNSIESSRSTSQWLYFGLGAVTVLGAGFMAARLLGR